MSFEFVFTSLCALPIMRGHDEAQALGNAERKARTQIDEYWQRVIAEKDAAIVELDNEIAEKKALIAELQAKLEK